MHIWDTLSDAIQLSISVLDRKGHPINSPNTDSQSQCRTVPSMSFIFPDVPQHIFAT